MNDDSTQADDNSQDDQSILDKITDKIPGDTDDKLVETVGDVADKIADMTGGAVDKVTDAIPGEIDDKIVDTIGNMADKIADMTGSSDDEGQ